MQQLGKNLDEWMKYGWRIARKIRVREYRSKVLGWKEGDYGRSRV
jgi:hypothetical protein